MEKKEVCICDARSCSKENSSSQQLCTRLSGEPGSVCVWPKRKFFLIWNKLDNPVYTIMNMRYVDSSSMKEV